MKKYTLFQHISHLFSIEFPSNILSTFIPYISFKVSNFFQILFILSTTKFTFSSFYQLQNWHSHILSTGSYLHNVRRLGSSMFGTHMLNLKLIPPAFLPAPSLDGCTIWLDSWDDPNVTIICISGLGFQRLYGLFLVRLGIMQSLRPCTYDVCLNFRIFEPPPSLAVPNPYKLPAFGQKLANPPPPQCRCHT